MSSARRTTATASFTCNHLDLPPRHSERLATARSSPHGTLHAISPDRAPRTPPHARTRLFYRTHCRPKISILNIALPWSRRPSRFCGLAPGVGNERVVVDMAFNTQDHALALLQAGLTALHGVPLHLLVSRLQDKDGDLALA